MNLTDIYSNVMPFEIWFYDIETFFTYIYYGKKETNEFYWVAVNFKTIKHMFYPYLSKYVQNVSKSDISDVLNGFYNEVMKWT